MEEKETNVDIAMDRFFFDCFFSYDHLGLFFDLFTRETASSFSSSMRADCLCLLYLSAQFAGDSRLYFHHDAPFPLLLAAWTVNIHIMHQMLPLINDTM